MLEAQSLSALVGDGEASERRNTVLDVSSSGSTSKHQRNVATRDGTVPAEGQRLSLISKSLQLKEVSRRAASPSPERIGCVVVTAAATEEHGHRPHR